MPASLDSDRPILAVRNNTVAAKSTVSSAASSVLTFEKENQKPARPPSTLTTTSTAAPSISPSQCSREAGITEIADGLSRLESREMQQQRFTISEKKSEVISKLALGAKLDRALRYRMSGQDAVHRPKISEKSR